MSSHGFDRVTGENFTSRSEVIAANGMVASSHPLATQIGLEILKQGGNGFFISYSEPRWYLLECDRNFVL